MVNEPILPSRQSVGYNKIKQFDLYNIYGMFITTIKTKYTEYTHSIISIDIDSSQNGSKLVLIIPLLQKDILEIFR